MGAVPRRRILEEESPQVERSRRPAADAGNRSPKILKTKAQDVASSLLMVVKESPRGELSWS